MIHKNRLLLLSLLFISVQIIPASSQESQFGTYRVTKEITGGAKYVGESNTVVYKVFNNSGRLTYEVNKIVPYDMGFPAAGIFESGILLLVDSFLGEIELYDQDGNLVISITPDPNPEPEFERTMLFEIHSSFAAFLISGPSETASRLIIIDDRGTIHLNRSIEVQYGSGITFSPDGQIIATGLYHWDDSSLSEKTIFLSKDGIQLGSADIGFTKGHFSVDDGTFLAVTNKKVAQIQLDDYSIKVTFAIPRGQTLLDAVSVEDGLVILSANNPELKNGIWVFSEPILRKIDYEGILLEEYFLTTEEFINAALLRTDDEIRIQLDDRLVKSISK